LHGYVATKFAFREAALDYVIEQAPPINATKLWRGFCPFDGYKVYAVGDVIVQKAPVSTTYDKSVAVKFMRDQACCILEVDAPAGTRGLYVESVSKYPEEREMLLPRGGAFKIKRVDVAGGHTVYVADWLPPATRTSRPLKISKNARKAYKTNFITRQRASPNFEDEVETLMMLGNMTRNEAEADVIRGILKSYGLGK
jgi:hypothetical protein